MMVGRLTGPERNRRIMIAAIALLSVLGFARAVFAQHPCDAPQPANAVIGPTGRAAVGFCHDRKDQNGAPITGPIAFRVQIDTVAHDVGELQPQGGPNAGGWSYYVTPPLTFGPLGGRVVRITARKGTSGVDGLASSPLPVMVMGLPLAPRGIRVAGG